ncbi:hypothetical protein MBLNU230_g8257t1 [Neophaeotheca triangularis]
MSEAGRSNTLDNMRSHNSNASDGPLSPASADRVFPIRSVVSVDPTPTPRSDQQSDGGYFNSGRARRTSVNSSSDYSAHQQASGDDRSGNSSRKPSASSTYENSRRAGPEVFNQIASSKTGTSGSAGSRPASERPESVRAASTMSRGSIDETGGLVTARFKHVVTEGGHAVITGRDGEVLQRCEDEPIHIPGAVQGFGLLIALQEEEEGKLVVRVVSENSKRITGYTPKQLFALESFTDILSEEQAENMLDHVDFIRDEEADVTTNGPEVFTMSIRSPSRRNQKLWCAMHINDAHPHLVICEFELEDDPVNPLVPSNDETPEPPEDTLNSQPTEEEYVESTHNSSKPLRVLRSARKRKGEAAAMEVFNIMSQVQEQLAAAPTLDHFLKILVGVVKELTGFHRVMIYQFDHAWNGRVVTELVDPRATKDLYKGLNFPASDIPKQARDLYKINKVRMLYDRDQDTARLVCRTVEDLEQPLDLTYSYLRAMSPIHIKYLGNMAVRSSMSISINAFDELWGLIACHSYGSKGMRVSFPIRKMCRLVGDSASRNIERLSYASRLQARKLINTVPTQSNPSGYIIASSEDLLKLFDADFGLVSIRDETKVLGNLEQSQEPLAMLEYLRMRNVNSVTTSQDIKADFPDLRYKPGFQFIAGLLLVPLSASGSDFIVFFRKGQLKEVKWAGNPYEKFVKEGTEGYLEPRKSFRTWSETVVGKCREWTEEEIETAAVLCLVYGKFIEVWRQKEAALQNSQLTKLLLANSAHEVRTPLNAIINYLEIALEGSLDQETRDNLAKSHSASKSLIYVINDLLDLTKTEEGGELTKDEEFDLKGTLIEATDMFKNDAKRKNISYEVIDHPGLPGEVVGDQRRVRQAISNITANAIQNTTEGGVTVEMRMVMREEKHCEIEIAVTDTGVGMGPKKLDALFRDLEQVQSEGETSMEDALVSDAPQIENSGSKDEKRTLGLGLALVARIIRNMNGQLRLKSEEGKGSRFVIQFPFEISESEPNQQALEAAGASSVGSTTPHADMPNPMTPPGDGEITLIERGSANRRGSNEQDGALSRHNSNGSIGSGSKSVRSYKSGLSARSRGSRKSQKSEADRLIDAIQEPHGVETRSSNNTTLGRSSSRGSSSTRSLNTGEPAKSSIPRPRLDKRHTTAVVHTVGSPSGKTRPNSADVSRVPENLRSISYPKAGESSVMDQGQPIKPIRVPDEGFGPTFQDTTTDAPKVLGDAQTHDPPDQSQGPPNIDNLHVLVAEDDPVNSRIIKKRLEKAGHEVFLTVNGEECSSAYGEKSAFFDVVLMDMQMPIVDGLTATKMIRSFEKSHPSHLLSSRASLNNRVPVIAVSASLLERDRQTYIDAGFDGWILKPISFPRLNELLTGIVDKDVRKRELYRPGGKWEQGGWFEEALPSVWEADTKPDDNVPLSQPSEGVVHAAQSEDPQDKEDEESRQTQEQKRMAAEQERQRHEGQDVAGGDEDGVGGSGGAGEGDSESVSQHSEHKSRSMPEMRKTQPVAVSEEQVSEAERTASPAPMAADAEGEGEGEEPS